MVLAKQVWKAKVFPQLRAHFASQMDSVTGYLVLYHEVALANLLEVMEGTLQVLLRFGHIV